MSILLSFMFTLFLSWLILPVTNVPPSELPPEQTPLPRELPFTTNISETPKTTSAEAIAAKERLNGIPFANIADIGENLAIYISDARPVDGNYECVLYDTTSYNIYADFTITAGYGQPVQEYIFFYENSLVDVETARDYLSSKCI